MTARERLLVQIYGIGEREDLALLALDAAIEEAYSIRGWNMPQHGHQYDGATKVIMSLVRLRAEVSGESAAIDATRIPPEPTGPLPAGFVGAMADAPWQADSAKPQCSGHVWMALDGYPAECSVCGARRDSHDTGE